MSRQIVLKRLLLPQVASLSFSLAWLIS
uniref:Uncharacterized protein n=1 Tax=Arundo donax TaxID=35708 RepID=A0A0A9GIE5_ARUDO